MSKKQLNGKGLWWCYGGAFVILITLATLMPVHWSIPQRTIGFLIPLLAWASIVFHLDEMTESDGD